MALGFVHACEQSHRNLLWLSTDAGGAVRAAAAAGWTAAHRDGHWLRDLTTW